MKQKIWYFINIKEYIEFDNNKLFDILSSVDLNLESLFEDDGNYQFLETKTIKSIFEHEGFFYKCILENSIVFDKVNLPEEDILDRIFENINEVLLDKITIYLKQKKVLSKIDGDLLTDSLHESLSDIEHVPVEKKEIIFHLFIGDNVDWERKDFTSMLVQTNNLRLVDSGKEYELFDLYDYTDNMNMDLYESIIHDIRCRDISLFALSILNDYSFIGYMTVNNGLKVVIKSFDYRSIQMILDEIKKSFSDVTYKSDLKWQSLMSRKVSDDDFRKRERSLKYNDGNSNFLKTTKSTEASQANREVIKKLLDKGYIEAKEIEEIEKIPGSQHVLKFLQRYTRVVADNYPEKDDYKGLWFDLTSGRVFKESKDNNDHYQIKFMKHAHFQEIYSVVPSLLSYLKIFWHQDFVACVFDKLKEDINKEGHLEFDYISDVQFDLLRSGAPSEVNSRDLDNLIKVRDKETNNEFLIAVEAKLSDEGYAEARKATLTKISRTYLPLFNDFITISYIVDKSKDAIKIEQLEWSKTENRKMYFVNGYCFNDLAEEIKSIIYQICGINKASTNEKLKVIDPVSAE